MKEAIISLAGVLVGFALGEGSRWIRDRSRRSRLRKALRAELVTIRAAVQDKGEILGAAHESLALRRVLPLGAVHFPRTIYEAHGEDIVPWLKPIERNILHVIYERTRVSDEVMDAHEAKITAVIGAGVVDDPFLAARNTLTELTESNALVVQLIDSFLDDNPIDVFPKRRGRDFE